MSAPSAQALDWVARKVGSKIERTRELSGGSTSAVNAITVGGEELVLRQFVDREWWASEPDPATREAGILRLLERSDVPTPRLVAVDDDGSESGHPTVLMSLMPGEIVPNPDHVDAWLDAIAAVLPQIHALPVTPDELPQTYFRYHADEALIVPDWSHEPDAWQAAFDALQEPAPPHEPTFIHRDYHPANILFADGQVSGVVDWVNACRGPAAVDVGHCRLTLAILYGVDVAERFRAAYERITGLGQDPYWDLMTPVQFLSEPGMFEGLTQLGFPMIERNAQRARMDQYVVSIVERL